MNDLPSPPSAQLVTADSDLERLCERWLACEQLALDTEFVRTRTFFARLGLIQVADPEAMYLLDATSIGCWEPLCQVLTDASVLKVLHSPSEDIELFRNRFELIPTPLIDTQIAATLAGVAAMPGYSRLVSEMFGLDLPKGQQRSDWIKRPLSESQKLYAGLDVAYLLPAWELLEVRLDELDRLSWMDEEMERLVAQCEAKNDPLTIYRRLAKANFNERQAGVLFELVAWRERQARKRDIPRKFVIGDDVLHEVAKRLPASQVALDDVRPLGRPQKKRLGAKLLEIVAKAPERNLDQERIDHRRISKGQLQPIRQAVSELSEELSIPLEFLSSKRSMEKLARRTDGGRVSETPPELAGWRWQLLGERLGMR